MNHVPANARPSSRRARQCLIAGGVLAAAIAAVVFFANRSGSDEPRMADGLHAALDDEVSASRAGTRPSAAPRAIQALPFSEVDEETARAAASRGQPDRDHDLHGRILDPAGKPVADAAIVVTRNEAREVDVLDLDYHRAERRIGETKSDAEGRFRFRLPQGRPFDLVVTAGGYPRTTVRDRYAGELVTIVLERPATLRGLVTRAADRAPVPDATVRVWRSSDQAPVCKGTTDPSGRFEFGNLEPGPVVLELAPTTLGDPRWRYLELRGGQVEQSDFSLDEGTTVTGVVADAETHRPIAGAEVGAGWTFFRPERTDSDGRYVLRGVSAQRGEIHARAKGYGRNAAPLDRPLPEKLEIDFALVPGRSVHGRVVTKDGSPVDGAYVAAISEGKIDWLAARTESDGRFEIRDLRRDERHALRVRKAGIGDALFDLPPREEAADNAIDVGDVVIEPAATISGTVVDAEGRALPDVKLELSGVNSDRFQLWNAGERPETRHRSRFCGQEGRTDDLGRFRFTDLASGEYRLRRQGTWGEPDEPELIVPVGTGESIDGLRLVIPIQFSIKGRVELSDGTPASMAVIEAYTENADGSEGDQASSCLSLGNGKFEIPRLGAGAYTLHVRMVPDETERKPAQAPAKLTGVRAGTSDLRVVLAKASNAPITGKVVDADGKAVKDALVSVTDTASGVTLTTVATGEDGSFAIAVQEGESFSLTVLTPQYAEGKRRATSWGPPTAEIPSVRAGTKSLAISLPKQ